MTILYLKKIFTENPRVDENLAQESGKTVQIMDQKNREENLASPKKARPRFQRKQDSISKKLYNSCFHQSLGVIITLKMKPSLVLFRSFSTPRGLAILASGS